MTAVTLALLRFSPGLWILVGTLISYAQGQEPITFIGGPSEFLPLGIKQARNRQDQSFAQQYPFRPQRPFPQPAGLNQYAQNRGLPGAYAQPVTRPYPFQNFPGPAPYPRPQGPPQVYPGPGNQPQPGGNSYPGGPPSQYPQATPPPVYQTPGPQPYQTLPPVYPTPGTQPYTPPVFQTSTGAEPPNTTPTPRTPQPTTRSVPSTSPPVVTVPPIPGTTRPPTPPVTTARTPGPRTPSPRTPAPRTPAPRTPAPRTPAPRTPAPRTPAPRTPAPRTPAPRTPAPRTPAPRTPAPRTPAPRTPAPRTPAPRTPVPRTPAPRTPAPRTPAPRTPAPRTPAPRTPAPRTPAPRTPAPRTPAPRTPAPRTPAPRTPAPRTPAPRTPAPRTPAPRTPAPRTPAPRTPAPRTPSPRTPRPPFTTPPVGTDEPITILSTSVPVTRPPFASTTKPVPLPNRIWGKPHVICEEDGILFTAITFFPFVGEVFARQRPGDPNCSMRFNGQTKNIEFRFDYKACGNPIQGAREGESMYSVEVVVSYDETPGGPSYLQQFLARCEHQRLRYATEDLPRRVEEALEELNLVPDKIERKAELPGCFMRVVPESVDDAHHYGKSNASEISSTNIGQKLRIEFGLEPPSKSYGFLVKNCTVRDNISGREYLVLDHNGCSTDINILQHPHYDTYNDLAIVHWHAFKVPDDALLSISCGFHICSDIKDNDGTTSCEQIPTPPYCPNLVSGPTNSILFDFERDLQQNFYARRQRSEIQVGTDVCISGESGTDPRCSADPKFTQEEKKRKERGEEGLCVSRAVFAGLLSTSFLGFVFSLGIFLSCRRRRRRRSGERRRKEEDAMSHYASSLSLHSHPRVRSS